MAAELAFSQGGVGKSGVVNAAQIGGYDLARKMTVNGAPTISLKGLRIAKDLLVDRDILIAELPHPTSLSSMKPAVAAKAVKDKIAGFQRYVGTGWKIEADAGQTNHFALGEDYSYRRGVAHPYANQFDRARSIVTPAGWRSTGDAVTPT